MVPFNYGEIMCVGELIEKLSKLPMDMPVVGTWEGIFTPCKSVTVMPVYGEEAAVLHVDQY